MTNSQSQYNFLFHIPNIQNNFYPPKVPSINIKQLKFKIYIYIYWHVCQTFLFKNVELLK